MQQKRNLIVEGYDWEALSKVQWDKSVSRLLKLCFVFWLSLTSVLEADDAAQPPYKKEKINAIPHVWLSGGLLLLKAQENGLKFANNSQYISSGTDYAISSKISPHFNWNTGVRIDAGYQPRNWYFFGTWTFIQNTAHGEKNTNGINGFFPEMSLRRNISSSGYVTSGFLDWKLSANTVDLGTILSWKPTSYLIVKNRVGMRIASLSQNFDVKYGGGMFNQGIDHVNMKNGFLGGGLYGGFSPNIVLPHGFTILADIAVSGLLGGFSVKQNEHYLDSCLFYASYHATRLRWMVDAKAAVNWQKELLYKILVFSVEVGVEWHEFFKQNELHHLHLPMGSRNVSLRGGFISLSLGF